jgi:Stage II sporulation protein E (SpoIIE)
MASAIAVLTCDLAFSRSCAMLLPSNTLTGRSREEPPMSENNSTRIYRWMRIWLGVGVLLALLLLGNSVRDYFFVSHILSVQQVRHDVTLRIAAFEHDLRDNSTPGASQLKLLTDEMAAAPQQPIWIVLRDMNGTVLEQSGECEREAFTPKQVGEHFRNREPLYDVFPTSRGEAVVEVYPVHPGGPPQGSQGPQGRGHGGPFISTEVAMPLSSADAASLWPIRRNLAINIASALALLLTVILTAKGFRSYALGKHLEQQVEVARQVQANLLPTIPVVADGVQLAVEYQPAQQVGGDFYDAFQTEDGLALVVGDVSGKGIPAALLMGVISGAIRSSRWTDSRASHERETGELNRLFCERAAGDRFASMFWGYCDMQFQTVHYVNAGHCAPILIGLRNGQPEIRRLDVGGVVLGVLPETCYTQGSAEIQVGDVLVLYSDGVVEAQNASGEEFGEARLMQLVSESAREGVQKVRDSILAGDHAFLGDLSAQDDLTCVVASFGPSTRS